MFYAVRKGRKPGVYDSWNEAKEQVEKFPGAVYKKFALYNDAEDYAFPDIIEEANEKTDGVCMSAYTDGSFLDNIAGWGYVLLKDEKPFYEGYGRTREHFGMRNIAGEIEAAETAIKKAAELGASRLDIYHDYEGIGRWPDGDWQATRERTAEYGKFVNSMRKHMEIHFHKVKGHSSSDMNNYADALAARGVRAETAVERYIAQREKSGEEKSG